MKHRVLGKTGIEVSEIGLGAWQVGGPLRAHFEGLGWISHGWGSVDDAASVAMIRTCGEMGINFIDTAAGYGAGHSEEVVGEAVSGGRDAWVIETKGGEGFTEDGVNWKDFSYARLLSQVDESLKRLQMEYVDVYLLHSPSNEDLEDGEALKALAEIKASGRARFVGVSLGSAAMGLDLIAQGVVDVLQVSLSIMDVRIAEELLPAAQKAGVGIVARGAMGAGFFTGKIDGSTPFEENDRRSWQSESSKASRAKVAEEFRFLEKTGRTLSQSYLKYVLSFEGISTVIPGSKTQAHMEENAGASEASELTEEEVTRVAGTRERLQAG